MAAKPGEDSTCHVLCSPVILWNKDIINVNGTQVPSRISAICFDELHQELILFSDETPNMCYVSDTLSGPHEFYTIPVDLPAYATIPGALLAAHMSPDHSLMALLISNREVKLLSTGTGEVFASRSCRGRAFMRTVNTSNHMLCSYLYLPC